MATAHRLSPKDRSAAKLLRAGLGSLYGCVLAFAWTLPAAAAPPSVPLPAAPESFATGLPASGPFGFLSNLSRTNYLLGDMWGLRTLLSRYGMSFGLQETSEVLGNATGGVRQGARYDGLTQMVLQLDTQRAFGWYGGTFNPGAGIANPNAPTRKIEDEAVFGLRTTLLF